MPSPAPPATARRPSAAKSADQRQIPRNGRRSGLETGSLDEWRNAAAPASGALGVQAGSRCCQFRRKRKGGGPPPDNFTPRDVAQFGVASPIARKRRGNRQNMHQHESARQGARSRTSSWGASAVLAAVLAERCFASTHALMVAFVNFPRLLARELLFWFK